MNTPRQSINAHPNTTRDRLPATLLVAAEVIRELRFDTDKLTGEQLPVSAGLRKLKYLRDKKQLDCIRVGNRTYLYTRAGLERFKKQNLMEAAV